MSTPELKELLETVRQAEAGSNWLDGRVWDNLCSWKQTVSPEHLVSQKYVHAACADPAMVRYSQSLDACLSLMGEVLPGYAVELFLEHPKSAAKIYGPTSGQNFGRKNSSATIALLDCILQALLNQEARKEKTDG